MWEYAHFLRNFCVSTSLTFEMFLNVASYARCKGTAVRYECVICFSYYVTFVLLNFGLLSSLLATIGNYLFSSLMTCWSKARRTVVSQIFTHWNGIRMEEPVLRWCSTSIFIVIELTTHVSNFKIPLTPPNKPCSHDLINQWAYSSRRYLFPAINKHFLRKDTPIVWFIKVHSDATFHRIMSCYLMH